MRTNHSEERDRDSSGATADTYRSRTSVRTMAVVVLTIVLLALFSKFGSDPFHTSTSERISGGSNEGMRSEVDSHPNIPAVDCVFLSTLENTINDRRQNIFTNWNVSYFPNFFSTMNIPTQSWQIQKAKYMKLVLEANAEHIELQHRGNNASSSLNFIAGFSGSSVTAGHDNYFHEAFPQVFFEALQPVFQAMGVNFTVRNHALGNNPCYPYDACIATHLGEDLDLLAWEQSMNCGRYPAPVDTFSRAAYSMPKKPTLLYLTSGGPVWKREDCLARNITTSGIRGPLTAAEKSLLAHTTAENALINPLFTQNNFLKDDNQNLFVDRFAQLAPMAQAVFGLEAYKCLGPYNASFCEKTPGGGAAHHPGRLMHKLRGENLAFFQLEMLREAVSDLQKLQCLHNSTSIGTQSSSEGSAGGTRKDIPSESLSLHAHLSAQLNLTYPASLSSLPQSSSRTVPSTTSTHIHTFVVEFLHYLQDPPLPSVPSKYNLPETSVPPTCHTSFEPRMSNALEDIVVSSDWHSELSFLDKTAVERSIAQGRGYKDRKFILVSSGINSTLSVNIQVKGVRADGNNDESSSSGENGTPVWLCEVQKGFARYPPTHADLPVGADVYIEYHTKPTTARPAPSLRGESNGTHVVPDVRKMTKLGLTQLKNECYRTPPVAPGHHKLTIVQNSDKIVNIAYVITW